MAEEDDLIPWEQVKEEAKDQPALELLMPYQN